jgi:hypothetical protein
MLGSLAPWGMMPWGLIPWSLMGKLMSQSLIPWSLILGQRSCAKICLSGHFFLDLFSLSLEKGALRLDMPA